MAHSRKAYYSVCPDCNKERRAKEDDPDSVLCNDCKRQREREQRKQQTKEEYSYLLNARVVSFDASFDIKEIGSLTLKDQQDKEYMVTGGYSGDLCITPLGRN